MSCCSYVGRILLVIFFVAAGVDTFRQPQIPVKTLNTRYPGFYKQLQTIANQYNVSLPKQFSPEIVKQYSQEIALGFGIAQLFLCLFVVLNQAWAGKLASFLTFLIVVIIHNPYIHGATQAEKLTETIQGLWTLGIVGGFLLIGSSSAKTCQPVAGKKIAPPAPTSKKAKRN